MIHVVGIGPGRPDLMTVQALRVIQEADYLFGSARQLEGLARAGQDVFDYKGDLDTMIGRIETLRDLNIVVLASGEPLLYGIGSLLRKHFEKVEIINGISSMHYIFSRIDIDMNDVYLTSAHGRVPDFTLWFKMPKLAAVTDSVHTPAAIARIYVDAGQDAIFYVGTQLSYPEEQVIKAKASEIQNMSFTGLSVVVIVNEG